MWKAQAAENTAKLTEAGMAGVTVGAIMGWLPAIAAIVSIVYYCIKIYKELTDK